MNRRGFLKSFGALAACAVAMPALQAVAPSEQERLVQMMRTGVIENQVFLFDGPIVIDIDNLIIRGCRLIFRNLKPGDCAITVNCRGLVMVNNLIEGDFKSGRALNFKPDDIPVDAVRWGSGKGIHWARVEG
jgi:hypothetical protein